MCTIRSPAGNEGVKNSGYMRRNWYNVVLKEICNSCSLFERCLERYVETGLPEMMVQVKHNEMSLISIMQLSPYSSNPNEIPIQTSKFTTPVIVFDTESNNDQWHTILQL